MPRFARHALITALAVATAAATTLAEPSDVPTASLDMSRLADALRSSESFKVRATAAVQLARLGDPRAATPLADALRTDEHYAVRAAAAGGLGRLAQLESIPALLTALHDADDFVREQANGALDRFHTPAAVLAFRDALSSEDPVWRLAAVRAYGDVLRENGSVAPFVIGALGDDDPAVARAAETAVSDVAHERAVPMLVGALQASSSPVRAAAARLLQKRADRSAVEPLVALVASSEEGEEVRSEARAALKAHVAYLDVAASLKTAANSELGDDPTRLTALRVVAALGDPAAWTAVKVALNDPEATVRIAGARAAADLGGEGARQAVEAARARETEPRVQRQLELIGKSIR